jgi:hypothetical protein
MNSKVATPAAPRVLALMLAIPLVGIGLVLAAGTWLRVLVWY